MEKPWLAMEKTKTGLQGLLVLASRRMSVWPTWRSNSWYLASHDIPCFMRNIKVYYLFTTASEYDQHLKDLKLSHQWRYILWTSELLRCVEQMITVAAQPKAWNIFGCSNTGIVGSDPNQGIDVCVFLLGSSLAMGWSPVQGVLLTVLN
jgi:hypothetical protein